MSRKMEEPRRVMIFQEHNVSERAYVWPRVFLNFQKRLRLVYVDVMTLLNLQCSSTGKSHQEF